MTKRLLRNVGIAAALSFCAFIFVCQQGFAQLTSGDLSGMISDSSGAAVPGATVEATNEATGVKATQTSNAIGEYRFSNLPIGIYDLSVSAAGFANTSAKGIPVSL